MYTNMFKQFLINSQHFKLIHWEAEILWLVIVPQGLLAKVLVDFLESSNYFKRPRRFTLLVFPCTPVCATHKSSLKYWVECIQQFLTQSMLKSSGRANLYKQTRKFVFSLSFFFYLKWAATSEKPNYISFKINT